MRSGQDRVNLRTLMRMSDVRRWHTVATVRDQTLADHSFRVAVIVMWLVQRLGWGWEGLGDLFIEALFHDCHEPITGDMPANRPAILSTGHGWRGAVCPDVPFTGHRWTNSDLISLADKMEAYLWARENLTNSAHNHAVIAECRSFMNDLAHTMGRQFADAVTQFFIQIGE